MSSKVPPKPDIAVHHLLPNLSWQIMDILKACIAHRKHRITQHIYYSAQPISVDLRPDPRQQVTTHLDLYGM